MTKSIRTSWNDFIFDSSPVHYYVKNNLTARVSVSNTNSYVFQCSFHDFHYLGGEGGVFHLSSGSIFTRVVFESISFTHCSSSSDGGCISCTSSGINIISKVCSSNCLTGESQRGQFYYSNGEGCNNRIIMVSCCQCGDGTGDSLIRLHWGTNFQNNVNVTKSLCHNNCGIAMRSNSSSEYSSYVNNTSTNMVCIEFSDSKHHLMQFSNILFNQQNTINHALIRAHTSNAALHYCSIVGNKANAPLFGLVGLSTISVSMCYIGPGQGSTSSATISGTISLFTINSFLNYQLCTLYSRFESHCLPNALFEFYITWVNYFHMLVICIYCSII